MKRFSELTGKEKLIELLRWLLVPAAAVLAVFALRFVAGLLMPPALAQLPGTPVPPVSAFRRFVLPRIFGILSAAVFVIAGAKTAPRRRIPAAVALAIVWGFYSLMSHILVHPGRGLPHYVDFAVAFLAAAGAAAYVLHSEDRKSAAPGASNDRVAATASSSPETAEP